MTLHARSSRRAIQWLACLALLVLAVHVIQILRYAPIVRPDRELIGVIHVHSIHSDGGSSFAEIARKAAQAGLDFVVVTDHGNPNRPDEKLPNEPIIIGASELSTDAGHMLAIGYSPPTYEFSPDPVQAAEDVRREGGFSVIAHPFNERIPWKQWPPPSVDGMEVINADSEWREVSWGNALTTLPLYWLNPIYFHLRFLHYPRRSLDEFDRLAAQRRFLLFAGLDAHANVRLPRGVALHFPDYEPLFRTLRVRLPGKVSRNRAAIVEALRSGAFYVSIDGLAGGGGFTFVGRTDGRIHEMGEVIPGGPVSFEAAIDADCRIRLLRDGSELAMSNGPLRYTANAPGAYRVEVFLRRRSGSFDSSVPWILSNPIFVGARYAEAQQHEAAVPIQTQPIHTMIQPQQFHVEWDYLSSADYDGTHLHFRLGESADPRAWPVVSLCLRIPPQMAPDDVVVVRMRSDRVYRVWLQAHQGARIYRASLRSTLDSTAHSIRVADFRPSPENAGSVFDPTKLTGLFLVLDRLCVPPGTVGDIWLDSVGVARRSQ